ncbi:DUF411 domain-containing protein [Sphingosinicella sp.]|uniref:DUF411 domain-containing protein n=1 Tax=Sphingosinicella sp. TaxID=1917971 RepID=UPI00403766AA
MKLTRRTLLATLAAGIAMPARAQTGPVVDVVKTPTCGCCNGWIAHMRQAGFQVRVRDVSDTTPVARRLGVPDDLRSCHTASVGGYAVEGHVPAADVRRLLRERPQAAGIAVPGMPMGSPGMEHGSHRQPYQTILFTRAGRRTVFARH